MEALEEFRSVLDQILAAKKLSSPDSKPLLVQGSVALLKLKATHRQQAERTNALSEATTSGRIGLDTSGLQLQNLLYEEGHYRKEIRGCQKFR